MNVQTEEESSLSLVGEVCSSDVSVMRDKLQALESILLQHDQVDIPVKHRFNGGMYAREINIPKGTLITGRIHKFDHFDIMLSGDITVSTDSCESKRLSGLNIMEGKAGKKRAGYAHKDTHWITFHSAEERDPEQMYEFLTCGSFEELEDFYILLNRADYQIMIEDIGFTEEKVQEIVQNEEDQTELPEGYEFISVLPSKIHGNGLFSDIKIQANTVICPARINDKRTIAGRYSNHAQEPNANMLVTNHGVDLVSLRNINAEEEITVNYRDVINHRRQQEDLCQE
ncbi:MAG: SET domain-containing protein-lysine N-methyltransferase [Thiomicrorhabdus sp.]|jgi:hypothetical protein|nr:SET domain-containing protein-lysine N-methyltransferase [Thiomicrorhabdus sp.]